MSPFVDELPRAISAHDLDALASCFTEDYRCDMPLHPARGFAGRAMVRKNWAAMFAQIPDIEARVLRSVRDGALVWSEWELSGTTVTGASYLARGVVIAHLHGEQAAQANFYLEPADESLS